MGTTFQGTRGSVSAPFTIRWAAVLLITGLVGPTAGIALRGQARDSSGWQIPQNAAAETSPLPDDAATVAKGQQVYKSKCQRCHGAAGKGNGPDAEKDDPPGDLTDARRAARNPDGVLFYKIWNGRSDPKMPAFKTDISRTDVWTVIQYIKTLRQPAPQ